STRAGWGLLLSFSAREALGAAMAAGPVRVRVVTSTRLYPSEEQTLIAEVRGSRTPSERFVMSAHVQEPGANDNASGVGAQTEIARVLASLVREGKADPARTLTFIWGDEIAGVRRFLREDSLRSAGVRWGLSLDMVGEDVTRTGGTFLIEKMPDPSSVWTRGEDRHTEWGGTPLSRNQLRPHYFNDFMLNRCRDQGRATGWVVKTNPYEGGSDHIPFLEAGKPGLLFWHFTDQFYHTDGDRIENVSAAELANAGVCALSAALILASADGATARYIADETRLAAIDRLAREGALSREAIAAGASRAEQKEILQAWGEWYSAALDAVREIEVGGTTAMTERRIQSAHRMLAAALERELASVARR
ncbi:MAG TPA: M28 family peptidase, partial [Gemmatimonadales bacterium]